MEFEFRKNLYFKYSMNLLCLKFLKYMQFSNFGYKRYNI